MATRMLKVKLEENNVNANNLENFEDFENNDDEGEFYPENDYQEEVDFRWILGYLKNHIDCRYTLLENVIAF